MHTLASYCYYGKVSIVGRTLPHLATSEFPTWVRP